MITPIPSTSSSSPLSSPTTPSSAPSSIMKEKPQDASSSDVEILDERNGSPLPQSNLKRKLETTTEKEPKKPKPSPPAPKKKEDSPPALVELKAGKFVLKQKALKLDGVMSSMEGRLEFTKYMVSDEKIVLNDWEKEKEHKSVVARLIHESDETATKLYKSVRKQLIEFVKSGMDEDSQEEVGGITLTDRIPEPPLNTLIDSLATRTNYGLSTSDFPADSGITKIPPGLEMWRWEVKDFTLLPNEVKDKLEKRVLERQSAKEFLKILFFNLPPETQQDLLSPSKKPSAPKEAKEPIASGSGVKKEVVVKEKKEVVKKEEVKVEDAEAVKEKEEKERAKAERAKEREAKKELKDRTAAEKEEKKAKKIAAEEKKKVELSKQSGFMTGFLMKKSASPAPVAIETMAKETGESDFDKVFKPFHVKNDVSMAPINRWRKDYGKGKKVDVEVAVAINSRNDLEVKEYVASFLQDVPSSRIRPFNPRPVPKLSVRDVVHSINDADLTGLDVRGLYRNLGDRSKVQVKLLMFTEDVRPGYIGTWTKTSRVVGPRTPFGKDTALLRYDYDSEDEWEEEAEGDGEDVDSSGERSDEDEDSDGEGGLSDDWLCEDDEVEFEPGHNGDLDGVVPMDVDDDLIIIDSATEMARKKVLDRERKSKMGKEGAARKKKWVGPLLPVVLGPAWEVKIGKPELQGFAGKRIQFLNDASFGLNPFTWVSKPLVPPQAPPKPSTSAITSKIKTKTPVAPIGSTSSSSTPTPSLTTSTTTTTVHRPPKKAPKPLDEKHMPLFVELIHHSDKTQPELAKELYEKLNEVEGQDKVTKAAIAASWKLLGAGKAKLETVLGPLVVWKVPEAILNRYIVTVDSV